jgi:hypothetical protein
MYPSSMYFGTSCSTCRNTFAYETCKRVRHALVATSPDVLRNMLANERAYVRMFPAKSAWYLFVDVCQTCYRHETEHATGKRCLLATTVMKGPPDASGT